MRRLGPFFPYYGSKFRLATAYPRPRHHLVIEPFAGAAGYAVCHHALDARLYDLNPVIVGVWDYLIRVPASEVRALPVVVERVEDLQVPQEARWLIGFWLNTCQVYPARAPSQWARTGNWPGKFWGERVRERIAHQVECIRHWRVECRSWQDVPVQAATWFVDPPYSGPAGDYYRSFRMPAADFAALGAWCGALPGQVIACEAAGARWLPFDPFRKNKTLRGYSHEAVWTNDGAHRPRQLELIATGGTP